MTRTRTLALTALGLALAAGPALAQEPQPRDTPPAPDGTICAPGTATVTTPRLVAEMPPISRACAVPGQPGTRLATTRFLSDGGVRLLQSTPRLVLRAGQPVRFAFTETPVETVILETWPGTRPASGRRPFYRLSPYRTVWRARPGSGLLLVKAVIPAPSALEPSGTTQAQYVMAYRAVRA